MPNPSNNDNPDEPTLITGLVSPSGAGGGRFHQEKDWTLTFVFETWRGTSGILSSAPLSIRRTVTEDELRSYMNQIQPYEVRSVQVIFTDSANARLITLFDEKIQDENDLLVQRAAELLKPKTFEHERFGTFTLNRQFDWYETKALWGDVAIPLYLSGFDEAYLAGAVQMAVELFDNQTEWDNRLRDFASQKLLVVKNRNWLDDDEPELTLDDFKSRMRPESVIIDKNRGFEFYFDDGGLFDDHVIIVKSNLEDGPKDAVMAG